MREAKDGPARNVTEARATIGALLRLPYESLAEWLYGELAAAGHPGVRRAHSAVFRHIAPGGSRLTDLAERAGMAKQSMAYLVDGLIAAGYLATAPDPSDGRARLVRLTESGREVQETLIRLSAAAEAECAQAMGAAEYARLRELLGRLAALLEARRPRAPVTSGEG